MRFRTTLAMGALLFLLCAAYLGLRYHQLKQAGDKVEAKRVFHFAPEDITELTIARIGEAPSAAVREAEGWRITQPFPTVIPFPYMWDRVCTRLAGLLNERTFKKPDLESNPYGLEQPALTVRFSMRGQTDPIELRFGDMTPTEAFRYAQMNAGDIFLVNKDAYFELDRPLELLRSRFLVDDRDAPLVRLEFARIAQGTETGANPPAKGAESVVVTLERGDPESLWRMTSPVQSGADQDLASKLVAAVQFAIGWGFVDAPAALSDYGLDPPGARVTVVDAKAGRRQTIYFGNMDTSGKKQGMFVKRDGNPAVFLVDATILGEFPKLPDAFRERRLLTASVADVRKIEYTGPADSFNLTRKGGETWQMDPPDPEGTDSVAVSAFLGAIKAAAAIYFFDGAPGQYGLDTPEIRIALDSGEKRPVSEIRLAPYREDNQFYVATQDTGQTALVPRASAEAMIAERGQFRTRVLLRFSKKDAIRLSFSLEGQSYVFEKAHDTWLVKAPEGKTLANQSDVETLLTALSPLTAESLENEKQDTLATYGLDTPVFTAEIVTQNPTDPDGAKTYGPLRIGAPASDNSQQRFATSNTRTGVYRIGHTVIDAARELLRGIQ